MDRAALAYIKDVAAEAGISRPALAERAGIPFQTLRGWWDHTSGVALSVGDLQKLLEALGVDGAEAYEEIKRRAFPSEGSNK